MNDSEARTAVLTQRLYDKVRQQVLATFIMLSAP
jgi:hypothetical protein